MGSGGVFFVQRHMARSAPAIIVTTLALTIILYIEYSALFIYISCLLIYSASLVFVLCLLSVVCLYEGLKPRVLHADI